MPKKMNKEQIEFEPLQSAMAQWNPCIVSAKSDDEEHAINIFSVVGEDWWSDAGMTASKVSAILKEADGADVTVNINSPGGSLFEGLAIHSLLANYDGTVNVKILGMAASAASVVALSGDSIEIADSGFIMIHNAWLVAVGNKEDMLETADVLEKFDNSMVKLYSAKTGIKAKEIAEMMKAETWLSGDEAIEMGFADEILGAGDVDEGDVDNDADAKYNGSLRQVDNGLAKAGLPRSKRRELIKSLTNGAPSAADTEQPKPCAGFNDALSGLLENLQS